MDYLIHKSEKALAIHESEVTFFDTLAVLAGCSLSIGSKLPDSLRPDVIRFDPANNILLIGDAKNTESPNCATTRDRLSHYLKWLVVHVRERNGVGVFGICFRRLKDTDRWEEVIIELAKGKGLLLVSKKLEVFDASLSVLIFYFR